MLHPFFTTRRGTGTDSKHTWRRAWGHIGPVADIVLLAISFIITSIVSESQQDFLSAVTENFKFAVFASVLFLAFNVAHGLYRRVGRISFLRQLLNAFRSLAYTAAVVFSVYFLTRNAFYTRSFLVVFFLVAPVMYLVVWTGMRFLMEALWKRGYGRGNTLLIGPSSHIKALEERIAMHPELGYDIRKVMRIPDGAGRRGLLHVEPIRVAAEIVRHDIYLIVFSSSHLNGSFDALEGICTSRGTAMRLVSEESEFLFSRARLQDFAGIPLFVPSGNGSGWLQPLLKRVFDIIGSSVALLLLSPLFLLVAILTKLESPGPVFFTQRRSLSDDVPPFPFYKFRSMHHLADERKEHLAHQNESSGALFKIKDDPRMTRIGRFIRRHSIDELPQLFNVLKGDMSLVGPRPLPFSDFERVTARDHMGGYFRQRAHAKPGMTGLWQISGRSELGFREMVLLDLYYIEHQSILFDIEILLQTIPVVLFGRGAY